MPGLTEQELMLTANATYDLGSGYPQLVVPPSQREIFRDPQLDEIGLLTGQSWTAGRQRELDRDLGLSVQNALGYADGSCSLTVTFSGAVAIDRAIAACEYRAQSMGYSKLEVITTSPSIDIIRDLLNERPNIRVRYAECHFGQRFPDLDLSRLVDLINQPLASDSMRAVLLTSPENPTGAVWSSDEMATIASISERGGFAVIVDHCFYLAGVQTQTIPAIWKRPAALTNWIGVWDTGKTFGFNGEKLGFILASPSIQPYVDAAVRVLQFDVSRRQKLLFTRLLQSHVLNDHLIHLNQSCVANLNSLADVSAANGVVCIRPEAGSLALLAVGSTLGNDASLQRDLIDQGVGLVTGSAFFHGATRRQDLLRVALARDSDTFENAMLALARSIELIRRKRSQETVERS